MIYYENHNGERLDLDSGGIRIIEENVRNYAWNYAVTNRPGGLGGRVKQFTRPVSTREMTVVSRGRSRAACISQLNALHALTEADVVENTNGLLWWDGQYIKCFLSTASDITEWKRGFHYAKKKLTVLLIEPYWVTETKQQFSPEPETMQYGKRYPLRYPYRYGTGYSNKTLYNSHYAAAPMIITVFGVATDPSIVIAGNLYEVSCALLEGERIEIDQIARKITKIDASGNTYSMFNARNKESDIFTPCPAGNVPVQFSGLVFEITLIQQRSEPVWT
jgi:hypothetical protein